MNKFVFLAGQSIHNATDELVKNAPAFGVFNGIRLEAVNNAVSSQDLVNEYHVQMEAQCKAYAASPEGQRQAAQRSVEIASNQAIVDWHIEKLQWLDCSDPRLVLYWIGGIAEAADDVGVKYDHAFVVDTLKARGWSPGANCKPHFNENDPRNYAGYIVGQWLESRYPMVLDFIKRWRVKFDGATP